jgi:WD40 repeat protein
MYSPDGKQIAAGGKDCTVWLWNIESGTCHTTLKGHEGVVRDAAYSPQGNQLASVSDDTTVRLWDVESGEQLFILVGHSHPVLCVAYSQKDDLLASGSVDKTVRIWNSVSGQCRTVVQNFQDAIKAVAWKSMSNGNYLVTGCHDGSVLKWQVIEETDQCRAQLQWSATNGTLTVAGASIQDVDGLTQLNKELLKQRGAVGEPGHLFHKKNKKVITMASVITRLRQPSDEVVQDSSSSAVPTSEQTDQRVEETDDL